MDRAETEVKMNNLLARVTNFLSLTLIMFEKQVMRIAPTTGLVSLFFAMSSIVVIWICVIGIFFKILPATQFVIFIGVQSFSVIAFAGFLVIAEGCVRLSVKIFYKVCIRRP